MVSQFPFFFLVPLASCLPNLNSDHSHRGTFIPAQHHARSCFHSHWRCPWWGIPISQSGPAGWWWHAVALGQHLADVLHAEPPHMQCLSPILTADFWNRNCHGFFWKSPLTQALCLALELWSWYLLFNSWKSRGRKKKYPVTSPCMWF